MIQSSRTARTPPFILKRAYWSKAANSNSRARWQEAWHEIQSIDLRQFVSQKGPADSDAWLVRRGAVLVCLSFYRPWSVSGQCGVGQRESARDYQPHFNH